MPISSVLDKSLEDKELKQDGQDKQDEERILF